MRFSCAMKPCNSTFLLLAVSTSVSVDVYRRHISPTVLQHKQEGPVLGSHTASTAISSRSRRFRAPSRFGRGFRVLLFYAACFEFARHMKETCRFSKHEGALGQSLGLDHCCIIRRLDCPTSNKC